MKSLTVRNIRGDVLARVRELAATERRSVNNEILVLLESALERDPVKAQARLRTVSPDRQARLWAGLCGRWRDERSWEGIVADIVDHRTAGRQVAL